MHVLFLDGKTFYICLFSFHSFRSSVAFFLASSYEAPSALWSAKNSFHISKSTFLTSARALFSSAATPSLRIACFASCMRRRSLCLLSEFASLASASNCSWSSALQALALAFTERTRCLERAPEGETPDSEAELGIWTEGAVEVDALSAITSGRSGQAGTGIVTRPWVRID